MKQCQCGKEIEPHESCCPACMRHAPSFSLRIEAAPREVEGALLEERTLFVAAPGKFVHDGNEIPLTEDITLIGKDEGCGLPLKHPTVSKRHARILLEESGALIQDLGSLNGTLVNQTPIPTGRLSPLKPGDKITIGKYEFILVEHRA